MLQRRLGMPYFVYVHGEELNVARTSRELDVDGTAGAAQRGIGHCQQHEHGESTRVRLAGEGRSELRVLHPGVDTVWFQPAPHDEAARSRLGWGNRRVILTVGRLQTRKGHDQLLRALSDIRKAVPDVLYAIVG